MRKSKINKIEKIYGEKEIDGVREKKEKAEGAPKKLFQGLALKKLRFRIPLALKFWRMARFETAGKKLSKSDFDRIEKAEEVFYRRSPRVKPRSSQVEAVTPVRLAGRDPRRSLENSKKFLSKSDFDGIGIGFRIKSGLAWFSDKLSFLKRSLASMSRKKQIAIGLVAFILIAGGIFMSNIFGIKAASYSWLQTDWSGGADTVNFPNHTSNQSGWTKFFSKDANVDVATSPGDAKLTQATGTSLQTSDNGTGDTPPVGGFNAWTKSNAYVSGTGTSASLTLLKPTGATCASDGECLSGYCNSASNRCNATNPWISGYCGIQVYNADVAGTSQWKTTNDACVGPQCATGLDTRYPSNYSLIWSDSSNIFASYPARLACYNAGGRLPTMAELLCIYTNKANLGTFQSNFYWSATESISSGAYFVYFLNGVTSDGVKTNSYYVRCVR